MSETTTAGKNRRVHVRRRAKNSTKVTCRKGMLDLGPNLALGVLDISETGIRLRLRETLALNQEVSITLEGMSHHKAVRIVGHVIWCVATAESEHCVGILFDKRLPYMELQKLA